MFDIATIDAAQMNSIAQRFNYPIILTTTNGYYDALAQGQRVFPLGGNNIFFELPNHGLPSPACVISNGTGGFKYNTENNGACNFMWQIDY